MDRVCLKRLIAYAMDKGAKALTPFEWEWDVAGRCTAPIRRDILPRAHREERKWSYRSANSVADTFRVSILDGPVPVTVTPQDPGPYVLHLLVRCRKCDVCRKERATMWTRRAITEIKASRRTWFGTLTLSPEQYFLFLTRARSKSARRAVDFDALTAPEQFAGVCEQIGVQITLMFKRWRKAGHVFRYLLVAEPHKSGVPHYHVLIHELADPIRKSYLDKQWTFGFAQWKLADRSAAYYCAKYISKTGAARVRASVEYGQHDLQVIGGQIRREALDPQKATGFIVPEPMGDADGVSSSRLPERVGAVL